MFNSTITVNVDSKTYNFGLISVVGSDSQRSNPQAPIGAPDFFRISKETKGKGEAAVNRHLVRVDTTLKTVDADTGASSTRTISAYVVLVVPQSAVTPEDVKLAYDKLTTFLGGTEEGASDTNFVRVLNGEP